MSWEEFDKRREWIVGHVAKLLKAEGGRRKYRLLAVHEIDTDEPVAEVFNTPFGSIVLLADAAHGGPSEPVSDVGRGRDVVPFTGDPSQEFLIRGRHQSYVIYGANLIDRAYPGNLLAIGR